MTPPGKGWCCSIAAWGGVDPPPAEFHAPSFRSNGRFWTRFGPFLMIWARTDILGGSWTSRTGLGTGLEAQDQARDWLGGPGLGQGLARRPWPRPARNADLGFDPLRIKKKVRLFPAGRGGSRPPSENKKARLFLFRGKKKSMAWLGQGLLASPWPGPGLPSQSLAWS